MYTPSATYRVQLSSSFRLQQLDEIIDYLRQLGVSTVYASPIFQARPGSTHGYDVTNPLSVSSDIGTKAELQQISQRLRQHKMGWLQDIVPNHMAYDSVNPWVYDMWEKGPYSSYATYFDVDWNHPNARYQGKVMIPSLGDQLEDVLAQGQLTLEMNEAGFQLAYYDHRFPLAVSAYPDFLGELVSSGDLTEGDRARISTWIEQADAYLANLTPGKADAAAWSAIKTGWWKQEQQQPWVSPRLKQYAQDATRLTNLLDRQYFRLVHWKTTEQEINYRRFFTVNDLICLNAQDADVFSHYHQQIKQWVAQDYFQGVRVDHIDGLYDPVKYLSDLRQLLGEETYISIEKILEFDETLSADWPIQGSSGYDFLADISQLYTDPQGEKALQSYYATWRPDSTDYEALVYRNKRFILFHRMRGELDNLLRLLLKSQLLLDGAEDQQDQLKEALAHLLIAFPVYRIYSTTFPLSSEDRQVLERAFERAHEAAPSLAPQFDQLRIIFDGEASSDQGYNQRRLHFIMRCQQFSGPLAAKGVEDTTFYKYFPLISHNEVGDSPHHLGISSQVFHARMQQRASRTMNATATHDTKRGEDARLRINLLSELSSEWMKETARWRYSNEPYKTSIDDQGGWPEANFEYFIYQTLLGTYPFHATAEEEEYDDRLKAFLLKAAKEAKGNTSWSAPNEDYEKAIENFVTNILEDQDFMVDFLDFAKPVAEMAVTYSLGQTLLKATLPGIPDVYQGSEYWDLSMVDPDNRRPVDYSLRIEALSRLQADSKNRPSLLRQLTGDLLDPTIKLYVLWQTLQFRHKHPELFTEGSYQPLEVRGEQASKVLAFRRTWQNQTVVVIAPLRIAKLSLTNELPLGERCWKDTHLPLADDSTTRWHNVFTNQSVSGTNRLAISEVLLDFPVALLTNHPL